MRYLAIFGGNDLACPAIIQLKSIGHKILLVDGDANSPGKKLSDIFIHQDFSLVKETLEALSSYNLSGALPLNDFAIAASASAARERGLPGWNVFSEKCFCSKAFLKQTWFDAGLSTPKSLTITVNAIIENQKPIWDAWPCIVKPSFSGGGSRGVFLAKNYQEIVDGIIENRSLYLDGDAIIEEFISGTEHTIEVVVYNCKPTILSISDKENYPESHTVVQNLYFPGPIGNEHLQQIENIVLLACKSMSLTFGAAHFEIILKDDIPYLLEVGGRPGGGINFHPICELSTGYNYPEILGSILTGNKPKFTKRHKTFHLAWHYFERLEGEISSIDTSDLDISSNEIVDMQIYEKVGQPAMSLSNDLNRPGYVLVKANSHELSKDIALRLSHKIKRDTI